MNKDAFHGIFIEDLLTLQKTREFKMTKETVEVHSTITTHHVGRALTLSERDKSELKRLQNIEDRQAWYGSVESDLFAQ